MSTNLGAIFITWFYWDAPRNILFLIRDFLAWIWQMFSIGFFLPRIFSPWHRDITGYGRGFDLSRWMQALVYNGISRIAGAVLRIFFIIIGLVLELLALAFGLVILVCWLTLPFIVIYWVATGVPNL